MRFLEYPELELSTNLAENSIRPVALGRKNWIYIGSRLAGAKVAAILSVVETCRRIKLPVRDYFAAGSPRACRSPNTALPRPYSRCVGRPVFFRVEPALFEYEIENTWPFLT
jgi:transposase IS66 family protein